MKLNFYILLFLLTHSIGSLSQEKIDIKGRILNSNGEGISFVNVYNVKDEIGVATDDKGYFIIETTNYPTVLKISFVGFKTIYDTLYENSEVELSYQLISDVFGLENVVVTGTRNEEKVRESVVGINVTNSKSLELVQAVSISEGLNLQPGIRTETNCQNCGYSQVRINGLPGKYSQILLNGRQSFSTLNSVYGLEQIPAVLIDRIEVVKGGGSALYGANAMGGVINLITKDPINSGVHLGVNSGLIGLESWEVNSDLLATYISKNNRFGLNFIGGYRFREPFDANKDGFTELPKLENYIGEIKTYYKPKKRHRIDLSLRAVYEYRRGGDQINLAPEMSNIAEELKSTVLGGDLSYNFYSKDKKSKFDFYLSSQYTNMDNYYGSGLDTNGYGLTTDFTNLGGFNYSYFLNKIAKKGSGKLVIGAEYRNNQIRDKKPGYNVDLAQDINNLGLFAQFDWKVVKWFKTNIGLRADYDNVLKKIILNPRLGVLFDTKPGVQIRLNYSKGYMAPQLFSDEIHAEIVSGEYRRVVLGSNLVHESSHTLTSGINYYKEKGKHTLFIGADFFYTQILNPFIYRNTTIDSANVLLKENGSSSYVMGINLELKYAYLQFFTLESGFTIQSSRYTKAVEWTDGQFTSSFLKTPDYYGYVLLSSEPLKGFTISSSLNITGSMNVPHYEGYIVSDRLENTPWFYDWGLKLSYDLKIGKKSLIFDLGIKNILNSYQSDFDRGEFRDGGYVYGPQRPRTLYFGMKFSTF